MTDETPNGVLLKGADGSHYFIPATDLSQYAVPHVTADVSDEVARTAPRLDAFSIDPSSGDPAVAVTIGPEA
jgi:hypothetical protein